MNGGSRCWDSLPSDALAYIINECGLCQADVASIRLVCVHWRSTTNSHLKSLAPACTSLEQVAGIAQRFPFLTNCDLTRCDTRLVGHASLCRDASARLSSLLAALSVCPSLTSLHISDTFSERMGQKHWASLVCAQALGEAPRPSAPPAPLEASAAPLSLDAAVPAAAAATQAGAGPGTSGGAGGPSAIAAEASSAFSAAAGDDVAGVGTTVAAMGVGSSGAGFCPPPLDGASAESAADALSSSARSSSAGANGSAGCVAGNSSSPAPVSPAPVSPAQAASSPAALSSAAVSPAAAAAVGGMEGGAASATADEGEEGEEGAGRGSNTARDAADMMTAAAASGSCSASSGAPQEPPTDLQERDAADEQDERLKDEPAPGLAGRLAVGAYDAAAGSSFCAAAGAPAAAADPAPPPAPPPPSPPPPLVLDAADLADPGIKSFARAISRPGATHQHAFWLPDWCGRLAGLKELHIRGRQRPSTGLPPCLLWLHAGRTAPQLTSLSLVRLSLVTLPEQLQHLTALTRLVAQDCSLSLMPRGLAAGLPRLQYMDLSLNGLTALPPDFTQLTSLKHLDLQRNKLVALPADIGRLSHVTCLLLNNNQLRQLPASLAALRCVEVLSCSYNWLGGLPALPLLCSLPRLRRLELACVSDVRCRLVPPQELRLLASNLTHLDLAANNLVPADVLGMLTSVRSLVLSDCGLLAVPPWVRRLAPSLQHLDLSNNSLSELPSWLSACTRLRYLSIAHNRLSLRVPPSVLEQMPQLEVVESE